MARVTTSFTASFTSSFTDVQGAVTVKLKTGKELEDAPLLLALPLVLLLALLIALLLALR